MINPTIKAQNLLIANVAASILATPPSQFNFANLSLQYPQRPTMATYGLTSAQYRQLFIPDVVGSPDCGLGIVPTLTDSSPARVAGNMNKFVAYISSQY